MKWDKVEVKTEQVVDEEPGTWILSAIEDLEAENFDSALEKLQQARAFAKNDPTGTEVTNRQLVKLHVCSANTAIWQELNAVHQDLKPIRALLMFAWKLIPTTIFGIKIGSNL